MQAMLFPYNVRVLGSVVLWRRLANSFMFAFAGAWGTDGAGRKQG